MLLSCYARCLFFEVTLRIKLRNILVFLGAFVALTGAANAQAAASSPKPTGGEAKDGSVTAQRSNPQLAAPDPIAKDLKRWLDIDALNVSTRYRLIDTDSSLTVNQLQYQIIAKARFKFDPKGKYSVYAGLFTGPTLTSGWNNTGWGTGNTDTSPYLKQLFFDAKPAKWLEVQFGGIAPNNGENTEITGYDNDVYLMGERVQIRQPKKLYFDEISVTNAFIGDVTIPNVFRRFKRLGDSNYHQLLVRKQFNKRVSFSADYTFESGRDFLRQAVNVKTAELKIVDHIVFENYQRIAPNAGYGFSVFGDKKVNPRLTVGGGFAHIDQPMFNADRFPPGNRLFANSAFKITRELSLNTFLIQAVGDVPTPVTPRTRLDIIFTFNVLEMLHHLKAY